MPSLKKEHTDYLDAEHSRPLMQGGIGDLQVVILSALTGKSIDEVRAVVQEAIDARTVVSRVRIAKEEADEKARNERPSK